jgi:hypothetical protein
VPASTRLRCGGGKEFFASASLRTISAITSSIGCVHFIALTTFSTSSPADLAFSAPTSFPAQKDLDGCSASQLPVVFAHMPL